MADLVVEVRTDKRSMEELRPAIDQLISDHFGNGLLQAEWQGDVLALNGPGARGRVTVEHGWVVGRATLRPPASFMTSRIEQIFRDLLERIA